MGAGQVNTKQLIDSVADLHRVTPWRGLAKSLAGLATVVALTWICLRAESNAAFLGWALLLGVVYSSLLILTHDALHVTLTGWKGYDFFFPRLISGPMLWFHALYTELHFLHHKMNGQDTRDPERVEPTREEYEQGSRLTRYYLRHQWWIRMFVFGGFGMIYLQLAHAFKLWNERPSIKKAFYSDLAGILGAQLALNIFYYSQGLWLRSFMLFLILERVIGIVHQFRSHIEHYGLWGELPKGLGPLDVQAFSSRNFQGTALSRFYFNGLNYHSVHHTFPRIPFYHLQEAQRRLGAIYASQGRPWIIEPSYFRSFRALTSRPRFIAG